MSEKHIVRRTLADRRPGRTDWARVDGMTEEEIEANAVSDPDVLTYFKDQGPGYQTRINAVLSAYVRTQRRA